MLLLVIASFGGGCASRADSTLTAPAPRLTEARSTPTAANPPPAPSAANPPAANPPAANAPAADPTVVPAASDRSIDDPIPVRRAPFELELLAEGFATPLWGTAPPGMTTHLFVVDQIGTVTALPIAPDGDAELFTFLDVGPRGADLLVSLEPRNGFDERGLLGLAFHPRYASNGLLYTYTSEPLGREPDFTTPGGGPDHLSVLREWNVDRPSEPTAVVNQSGSRVLLRIEQPQGNHNGGGLVFGPDEMLYIALGDGGGRDDRGSGHAPGGNGQDLSEGNLLGKILRIDPLGETSENGAYGVPPDNPFVDAPGSDEIWAYGLRNPFRISFDLATGDLYAADVGQGAVEEVNLIVGGANFGWPRKEGTFVFDQGSGGRPGAIGENSPGAPAELIDPIAQYNHREGVSVTGGFVYRGDGIAELVGTYVFGDLTVESSRPAGRLFALDAQGTLAELRPTNADEAEIYLTGFGQDGAGELYVMGLGRRETAGGSGVVFKLVPTGG